MSLRGVPHAIKPKSSVFSLWSAGDYTAAECTWNFVLFKFVTSKPIFLYVSFFWEIPHMSFK